jgi:hypothetical protein
VLCSNPSAVITQVLIESVVAHDAMIPSQKILVRNIAFRIYILSNPVESGFGAFAFFCASAVAANFFASICVGDGISQPTNQVSNGKITGLKSAAKTADHVAIGVTP